MYLVASGLLALSISRKAICDGSGDLEESDPAACTPEEDDT